MGYYTNRRRYQEAPLFGSQGSGEYSQSDEGSSFASSLGGGGGEMGGMGGGMGGMGIGSWLQIAQMAQKGNAMQDAADRQAKMDTPYGRPQPEDHFGGGADSYDPFKKWGFFEQVGQQKSAKGKATSAAVVALGGHLGGMALDIAQSGKRQEAAKLRAAAEREIQAGQMEADRGQKAQAAMAPFLQYYGG